ncbi:DUF4254 domain-containing protein [Legionella hackeliae]|uniref:DUF4254 domain-containing protein n=1 Tax=Legionella hackeliae TaxID=449 RepID=A0A0A8UTH7_LEGHA|nr:DUF4254 domain-containing protein [Legionella hackeliae]KTD12711.1 hypothetical protein Lhac_1582 [Legionella hackeliae]CEK12130.1 conserved protein of unknown function [Legionella hackeliae]STX48916.1 Uncharacterised protein [Legionella hackeliae]
MFELQVSEIARLHKDSIIQWKASSILLTQTNFMGLVEENHAFNYRLWHAEDKARREDMGFEFVYHAKREIDYCNQQRNNRMEAMDEWLFTKLQPAAPTECPVHSETPGMMIDRLSILALKAYHMELQVHRQDVDELHRQACQRKWQTIQEQQKQLLSCLSQLCHEVTEQKRTFRVYHQFKMYNDPSLNPELYQQK